MPRKRRKLLKLMATIRQRAPILAGRGSVTATIGDVNAPTVPQGLTATTVSSSQINLAWSASTDTTGVVRSGVVSYKVRRGGTLIATVSAPSVTYQNTGLTASTSYTYTVSAVDGYGNESAQSGSASATTQAGVPSGAVFLDTRFLGLDAGTYPTTDGTARRAFRGTDSVTGQVFNATTPQLWTTPDNPSQYIDPSMQFVDSAGATVWPTSDFSIEHGDTVGGLKLTALSAALPPRQAAYQISSMLGWQNQGMFYIRLKMRVANMPNMAGDRYFVVAEVKHNVGDGPKVELIMRLQPDNKWYLQFGCWTGGITNHPWKSATSVPWLPASPPQTSFYASTNGQAHYFSQGIAKVQSGYTGTTSAGVNDGSFAQQGFSNWMMFEFAGRTCDSSGNVCGLPGSPYGNGWLWAASGGGTSATVLPTNGTGIQRFYVPAQTGLQSPAWMSTVGVPFSGNMPGVSILFPFNCYSNHGTTGVALEIAHSEVRGDWPNDASPHPAGAV